MALKMIYRAIIVVSVTDIDAYAGVLCIIKESRAISVNEKKRLHLFHKLRFEFHSPYPINFTINVMIAINQTYVFDFSANFYHQ